MRIPGPCPCQYAAEVTTSDDRKALLLNRIFCMFEPRQGDGAKPMSLRQEQRDEADIARHSRG
jgi:hypothetical protein